MLRTSQGPMAEGASPVLLRQLLRELEEAALTAGCDLHAFMRPGLAAAQIDAALEVVGLTSSEEIRTWFSWHDGQVDGPTVRQALPNFVPASLDLARSRYRMMDQLVRSGVSDGGRGGLGWLPLHPDTFGLGVDATRSASDPPQVRSLNDEFFDAEARSLGFGEAVSLCTPVVWWIEQIQSGSAVWDPRQRLWEVDFTRLPPLKAEIRFD